MRRVMWICSTLACAMGASGAAYAEGPYVGASGGVYLQRKLNYDFIGFSNFFDSGYKRGYDAAAKLGYDFEGLRVEAEISYKRASANRFGFQIDGQSLATQRGSAVTGNAHTVSGMLNAYYDITQSRFRPYVGGGVGVADVDSDRVGYAGFGDGGIFLNKSDIAFAFQAMAGVNMLVGNHVMVGVGYRYFDVPKVRLAAFNTTIKSALRSSSVMASLTYNFAAPRATTPLVMVPTAEAVAASAAVAPPPPPPVQTGFVVTFAAGGSTLTADARAQLDGAAAGYAAVGHASVMIASDAETTGPALYDERLASRRAERAKTYLVAHGTPKDAITIQTFDSANAAAGLTNVNPRGSIDLTFGPGSGR